MTMNEEYEHEHDMHMNYIHDTIMSFALYESVYDTSLVHCTCGLIYGLWYVVSYEIKYCDSINALDKLLS